MTVVIEEAWQQTRHAALTLQQFIDRNAESDRTSAAVDDAATAAARDEP